MSSTSRTLVVICLTMGVFLFSCLVMYLTWIGLSSLASEGFEEIMRGLISLLAWIVAFAIGAVGFWKIVARISYTKSGALVQ